MFSKSIFLLLISLSYCGLSFQNTEIHRGPGSHYLTLDDIKKEDFWNFKMSNNYTDCYESTDGDHIGKYSIPAMAHNHEIKFSEFKDKAILIVNVATYCSLNIEYPQLFHLKEQFGDKLEIVGFPSNNFYNQEPAKTPEEFYNGLKNVRPGNGFVPNFKITQKIDVNGAKTHPIYSFLKRSCPATKTSFFPNDKWLIYEPKCSRDIRWNFEKFLVCGKTGRPFRRYDSFYQSKNIEHDIKLVLEKLDKV